MKAIYVLDSLYLWSLLSCSTFSITATFREPVNHSYIIRQDAYKGRFVFCMDTILPFHYPTFPLAKKKTSNYRSTSISWGHSLHVDFKQNTGNGSTELCTTPVLKNRAGKKVCAPFVNIWSRQKSWAALRLMCRHWLFFWELLMWDWETRSSEGCEKLI